MEIFERNGKWVWAVRPGVQKSFNSQDEAYKAAGMEMPTDLPLPEVREYDSMEEAIAEED